jgi:hypothetical protein
LGQLQSKTVKVCRVLRTGGLKKTVVSNRRKCQDVPGQSLRMTIKHLLDFWYLHFDPMCGKKQTTWDTATEKKHQGHSEAECFAPSGLRRSWWDHRRQQRKISCKPPIWDAEK